MKSRFTSVSFMNPAIIIKMQELQPTSQTHAFSLSQFLLQITLKYDDSKPLIVISLTHHISRQRYYLQINQQTIDSIQGLSKFYENPAELYQQLLLNMNDIKIDDDGRITFEIMIGKSKKKKVTLDTAKVEQKEDRILDWKSFNEELSLLKKSFNDQTLQMKLQRQKLVKMQKINQEKDIQRNKQFQSLRRQLLELKQAFEQKNSQNMHLGEAVAALTLNIKQLKTKNQAQVHKITQKLAEANQRLKKLEEDMYSDDQIPVTQINSVKGHRQHKNNELFDINRVSDNQFRISILYQGNQYNSFIHTFRAFPDKITQIKVCIAHSIANQIFLGVCTKNLLNNANIVNSKDCIALNFKNGTIVHHGKTLMQTQYKISARQVIMMQVDLVNNQIAWLKLKEEETILHQLQTLPQQFMNKQLFLHISMIRTQDAVDIITD